MLVPSILWLGLTASPFQGAPFLSSFRTTFHPCLLLPLPNPHTFSCMPHWRLSALNHSGPPLCRASQRFEDRPFCHRLTGGHHLRRSVPGYFYRLHYRRSG